VLLVERRLRDAGLVTVGEPVARRIRRQELVRQHEAAVGADAEFELRVGQQQALLRRPRGAPAVQLQGRLPDLLGECAAQH